MTDKKNIDSEKIAEHLFYWLSKQKYGDEHILHPSVCCDFSGMIHFKKAIKKQIEKIIQEE